MKPYPRLIQPQLESAFRDTPVVCLLGPRQAGKTTLAQQLQPARSYISFDDQNLLDAAQQDPMGFVAGLPERVTLDEIQRAPQLLLAIKASVDANRTPGRFLLTGSANLLRLPKTQDSLAGRMEVIELQPLSELEKQRGKKSLLEKMLNGQIVPKIVARGTVVADVAKAVCRGGYPEPNTRSEARARQWYRQYLDAMVERDAKDIDSIHDSQALKHLMQLLAARTASLLNLSSLAGDLSLSRQVTEKYLGVLEKLYLVRRLPAWHQNNAKRLVKAPKIHLTDSGLATALNRLSLADWNSQGTAFGHLLKSFVVQQFACHASWLDPDLHFSHYRDKDKVEVDLVIERGSDLWAVEVKRSATVSGGNNLGLARLAERAGKRFRGGVLLYSGASCLPLKTPNCFAVPLSWLWE